MDAVTFLVTGGSLLFATAGQLLMRLSQGSLPAGLDVGGVRVSWVLAAALACHGVSAVLWARALARAPLASLYPATALMQFLVPAAAWAFLGERMGPRHLLAAALGAAAVLAAAGG